MVNSCAAFGCKNRDSKGSKLTFHKFPLKEKLLLKLWLVNVRRRNWIPSEHSVLCSEHFTPDCFTNKGLPNSKTKLKNGAYPTLFCFNKSVVVKRPCIQQNSDQSIGQDSYNFDTTEPESASSTADMPTVDSTCIGSDSQQVVLADHSYHIQDSPERLKAKLIAAEKKIVKLRKKLKLCQQKLRRCSNAKLQDKKDIFEIITEAKFFQDD